LVPGLLCSARLYVPQIAVLWRFGQEVAVADHRRDTDIAGGISGVRLVVVRAADIFPRLRSRRW